MSILGTWDLTVRTPIGSLAVVYTFTETAGTVRGTAAGKGETVTVTDIAIEETSAGSHVTWRQSVTTPIRLNLDFDVTTAGDELTGHSRAGRLPRSGVTGIRRTAAGD
ncbi:hypothetical protein [Nocardia sp. NBC_01327]|uniref:hypothetical protein n=1 Tax=Nocardia sp. NBC_01327 TaxID=2903593 RepID=UPI002E0E7177|nr:hypothetical protein OG326_26285 [Nocardia sp. NBC_01327]